MNITIVTPWLNHRELEHDYFAAIRNLNAAVLIVDDGSCPPLPNALRSHGSGFAAACNAGLNAARTDAVLFLNNDIAATRPDWLKPIMDALEPGVLVGPDLVSPTHSVVDGIAMPYLDGWCLAGMRNDLLELGGWDETFDEPSYYGDNELCLRARANGMILREARVALVHKRNQTAGAAHDLTVQAATVANRARYLERARELLAVAA